MCIIREERRIDDAVLRDSDVGHELVGFCTGVGNLLGEHVLIEYTKVSFLILAVIGLSNFVRRFESAV